MEGNMERSSGYSSLATGELNLIMDKFGEMAVTDAYVFVLISPMSHSQSELQTNSIIRGLYRRQNS